MIIDKSKIPFTISRLFQLIFINAKKRTKSEVESTSGNGMSRKKKLEAYFVNLIDIQKMFQFKIHKYLRIDPGGGQISPPS